MSITPTGKQINAIFAQLDELQQAVKLHEDARRVFIMRLDNWAKKHAALRKDMSEADRYLRDEIHKLVDRVAVLEARTDGQVTGICNRLTSIEKSQATPKVTPTAKPVPHAQYVVAYGNSFDGLTLVGPFDHHDDANGYAESDDDWQIVMLQEPAHEE